LVTFALALGAFLMFYILFFPKPASPETAPARPTSAQTRPDGYQVAWLWLKSAGVPVAAWRESYRGLERAFSAPGGGNLLLTLLPHELEAKPAEILSLEQWVRKGNTLLVMAALDDTPAWAVPDGSRLIDEVNRLSGLKVQLSDANTKQDVRARLRSGLRNLLRDRTSIIEARGMHPLLRDVHSLRATSEYPAARWRAAAADGAAVLEIANIQGSDDAAIWLRREGKGQVITIGFAGLFSNRDLSAADNGRLLSNILAWSLQPGGAVIFDDAHQGVVDYYDARAFFADPRLHRSIAWLVFLWLVFVLGIQRLRVHAPSWRPVDITAFIGVSGDFLASTTTPAAAAARMLANFFNAIRRRLNLREDGVPVWDWLAQQPAVDAREVRALRKWHARAQSQKRVDLLKLQSLIRQVQEKIR
jgi:Domain of unknown function (DUF4350)